MINYSLKKIFNPIIFFALIVTVFFFDIIFLGKTYFLRDLTFIFHPWKMFVTQYIQIGKMPLWNHYAFCGMPHLANWQSAVFYPFSMFFSFFNFVIALKLYFIVNMFIGGMFVYLFSRQNKLTKWQSIATAILFSLNGYMITKIEFLSYFGANIWIFALLLFRKNPIILGLAISFAFFAGHQIFFCILMILIFYFFMDFNVIKTKSILKNLILAGFISLGIVACQILPTIELAKYSERAAKGIEPIIAMFYSLKYSDLFNFLSPYLSLDKNAFYIGEKFGWTKSFYVGFIVFAFILWKTLTLPLNRTKVLGFFLLVMGILFSLGDSTPIYPWFYKHFFSFIVIRYPFKLMIFSIVGIILLFQESLKNFRPAPLLVLLFTVELLVIPWNFQPKINDSYFSIKPDTVGFFEKNLKYSRFILSPGTETGRSLKAKNLMEGWQKARSFLYGLVCLPYHIPYAYGIGEPLAPSLISGLVNAAYTQKNPREAIPFYKKLGVKYLICKNKLNNDSGYKLEPFTSLNIYSIKDVPENTLFTPETKVRNISISFGKILAVINSDKKTEITFNETYLPGWKTYINKKSVPTYSSNEGFRKFEIVEGENRIWQIYMPGSYKIGLIISIIFICGILIFSMIKLNKKIQ
ncbi:MAG: YfhO family protein [Elusimicrobia bacterium]|nr:YfhO family protein [Elusimicrobiota bacterium]